MSDHTRNARAKAEAEFEKLKVQAREREKMLTEQEAKALARDENTARLKGLRLAREQGEQKP